MRLSGNIKLLLALGWFCFISILFFMPESDMPHESWLDHIPHIDKLVHIVFFYILTILWTWRFPLRRQVYLLVIIAVIYGLLVEFIQLKFVPSRSYDLLDWAADCAGVLAGYWFWWVYIKK